MNTIKSYEYDDTRIVFIEDAFEYFVVQMENGKHVSEFSVDSLEQGLIDFDNFVESWRYNLNT